MPGKSGRSLIFWGRVLYAHSTISSKLLRFAVSAMRPTLLPEQVSGIFAVKKHALLKAVNAYSLLIIRPAEGVPVGSGHLSHWRVDFKVNPQMAGDAAFQWRRALSVISHQPSGRPASYRHCRSHSVSHICSTESHRRG